MKKSILSIAILAAGLLVASCGNKSANTSGGGEAGGQASTEETQDLPEVKTSYSQKTFTVSVPEGWNTLPNRDEEATSIMFFKGEMEQLLTNPVVNIDVEEIEEGKSFEDGVKEVEATGAKPIADVTIDGKTYKGFEMTEDGAKGVALAREEGGKTIALLIANVKHTDPEVLAILKSLKLK